MQVNNQAAVRSSRTHAARKAMSPLKPYVRLHCGGVICCCHAVAGKGPDPFVIDRLGPSRGLARSPLPLIAIVPRNVARPSSCHETVQTVGTGYYVIYKEQRNHISTTTL